MLSELDEGRRKYILSNIRKRQVIITACESTAFSEVDDVNFIYVNEGKLSDFSPESNTESINEPSTYENDEKTEE